MHAWQWRRLVAAATVVLVGTACSSRHQPTVPISARYVGLGDSYASGEGNPPYDTATDVRGASNRDLCHRSASSYPRLVATAARASIVHVACSGARLDDLTRPQYSAERPQLDAVTPSASVVMVSIGANDLGATSMLFECVVAGITCQPGTTATDAEIAAFTRSLTEVLRDIRARAPSARVLVLGYPQILPDRIVGPCPALLRLPSARQRDAIAWFANRTSALDGAIRVAAASAGVEAVDTERAFAGHDVCSADPWVYGTVWPVSASFHPTPAGQRALAASVEAALSGGGRGTSASTRAGLSLTA